MPKISIIIVNHNGRHHLARCLGRLCGIDQSVTFETLVFDNASRDGSRLLLAEQFPQVQVIESEHNLGFSTGCNAAARLAVGQYFLFLNSDTEVIGDALQTLSAFLDEHREAGVVTARLVYPDLSDQGVARSFPTAANAIWGRKSLLTRLFPRNRFSRRYLLSRENPSDRPFEVDWVSGACLMISAEAFREVGGFDEKFFMYWEDADLCFRVKERGWRVFAVPAAVVIHHEGGSSGRKARLIVEFHRSVYRYYRKHHVRSRVSPANLFAVTGLTLRAALLLTGNALTRLIPMRR